MAVKAELPPTSRVRWNSAHRIIPSRFPPIDLFERVAPPGDWEALIELESLTNARLRDEVGEIHLVPQEERISGPGASYVMACFTHRNPTGSRFSDGSYGVYYAGKTFETALRETVHHMGKFYAHTDMGPHNEDMRVLVGSIDTGLHDIRGQHRRWKQCLEPSSYQASQALARSLKELDSNGIVYPSVRHVGGECVGVFRPKCVKPPKQASHLRYHWDGKQMTRYFDYARSEWCSL